MQLKLTEKRKGRGLLHAIKFMGGILLCLLSAGALQASDRSPYADFEKLKSLVGEWQKEGGNGDFYIAFELTAKGSVLVENWHYKGALHSSTVYHLDGDAILATHYCPQGNQPRLRQQQHAGAQPLSFALQDVTNLASEQASHQVYLAFELLSAERMIRREAYRKGGEDSPSQLELVRRTR